MTNCMKINCHIWAKMLRGYQLEQEAHKEDVSPALAFQSPFWILYWKNLWEAVDDVEMWFTEFQAHNCKTQYREEEPKLKGNYLIIGIPFDCYHDIYHLKLQFYYLLFYIMVHICICVCDMCVYMHIYTHTQTLCQVNKFI